MVARQNSRVASLNLTDTEHSVARNFSYTYVLGRRIPGATHAELDKQKKRDRREEQKTRQYRDKVEDDNRAAAQASRRA